MAAQTHGLTEKIKHENTTRHIKYFAESADFNGFTFKINCNGLTCLAGRQVGNSFEMPNVSTVSNVLENYKDKT